MTKKTWIILLAALLLFGALAFAVLQFLWFPVSPDAVRPIGITRTAEGVEFDYLQLDSGYVLTRARFTRDGAQLLVRFYGSALPALAQHDGFRYTGDLTGVTELCFWDGKTVAETYKIP